MAAPRLLAFDGAHAATVISWCRSADELDAWASVAEFPPPPDVFARWHAPGWAHGFVLVEENGAPAAYGEIWDADDGDDAELARILVAPERRGRGIGRACVGLLVEEARRRGFASVQLRVVPSNAAAIACYRAAGFVRLCEDEERAANAGQPRVYVWMKRSPG